MKPIDILWSTRYSSLECLVMSLVIMLLIEALPNAIHIWGACDRWFSAIYSTVINTIILISSLVAVMRRNATMVFILGGISMFIVVFEGLSFIRDNTESGDKLIVPHGCRLDKQKHVVYGIGVVVTYVALSVLCFLLGVRLNREAGQACGQAPQKESDV